jgi:hypothetical protein
MRAPGKSSKLKSNYNSDRFKHVISENQINILQNSYQEVLIGSLLGDGCITRSARGLNHFRFKQSTFHSDYFFFIFLIFKPFLTLGSPSISCHFDKRFNKLYESLTLQTRPIYNNILNINNLEMMFYNKDEKGNRFKRVPLDIISMFSPISLAIWIMDDGHLFNNAVYLNVQSFKFAENKLLILALNKLGITAKLIPVANKNNQWRIIIPAANLTKLRELVIPYMTKSMFYKLGL